MPDTRPRPLLTVLLTAVVAAALAACAGEATAPAEVTVGRSPGTTASVLPPGASTDQTTSSSAATATTAAATAPPPTTTGPDRPRPPHDVVPFENGAAVAAWLGDAEAALADPVTPGAERTRWAWVQQQAYRDLAVHPGWRFAARRSVPAPLRPAFDLNLRAVTQLRALTDPQPALPDWSIVAPPPVAELRRHYAAAEAESGVPWSVLAAIHLVETRFGRIRGDSPAGARGPMQFLPATWEAYGEGDIMDPGDAIAAAGRYLAAHGAATDLAGAVYAYNHSDRYVDAVLAHAAAMERFDHYLEAYHAWRVYYRTVDGDVLLEEGWPP